MAALSEKFIVRDCTMSEGETNKKSPEVVQVWFITSVYNRRVRRFNHDTMEWEYVPDYEDYKNYLNERIADFYQNYFVDILDDRSEELELLKGIKPKVKFNASLEFNNLAGFLHHHVAIELVYPRIDLPIVATPGTKRKEATYKPAMYFLNYRKYKDVLDEVVPLNGVVIHTKIEPVNNRSLENILNYIDKKK